MSPMNEEPKKANAVHQVISVVCLVTGIAVALGAMYALGLSGAIPGAVFGAVGGVVGGVAGWLITSCLPK